MYGFRSPFYGLRTRIIQFMAEVDARCLKAIEYLLTAICKLQRESR